LEEKPCRFSSSVERKKKSGFFMTHIFFEVFLKYCQISIIQIFTTSHNYNVLFETKLHLIFLSCFWFFFVHVYSILFYFYLSFVVRFFLGISPFSPKKLSVPSAVDYFSAYFRFFERLFSIQDPRAKKDLGQWKRATCRHDFEETWILNRTTS